MQDSLGNGEFVHAFSESLLVAVHVVVEDVARIKHERWVCPAHLRKAKLQGEDLNVFQAGCLMRHFILARLLQMRI